MFWQIFDSMLAKRRATKTFLKGADSTKESKNYFFQKSMFWSIYKCRLYTYMHIGYIFFLGGVLTRLCAAVLPNTVNKFVSF